jgi:ribosomal protein L13E
MQEIIDQITSKVSGVTADQAQGVVNTLMEFLKTKVPAPVVDQLQKVMTGQEFSLAELLKDEAGQKLGDLKDSAAEKLEDLKDSAQELLGKIGL